MECKNFQNLLIQLPYNELNEEETTLLEDHLNNCNKCLNELKKNEQLFEFTRKLIVVLPEDKEKRENINSILTEIKSPKKIQSYKPFNYRIIRLVINTAAVFLIGLFLFQQMEMKRNLELLNAKMQQQENITAKIKAPVEFEIISYLGNPAFQKHLNISEKQVLEIIENYQQIKDENVAILRYLQLNYPEVYNELQRKLKKSQYPT